MTDDDLHDIRPIPELLRIMERIAVECEAGVEAVRMPRMFVEALHLCLEIRVPRMPDTDAELERMLKEASVGETFTTEEVIEHLARSQKHSEAQRAVFRVHLASGSTAEAARMLMPGPDQMIRWERDIAVEEGTNDDRRLTIARQNGRTVECRADDAGLAMLGVAMRMHAWTDTWKR